MHWVILMVCVGNFDNLPETRALQVGLVVKNPPVNAGDARDMGSIPEVGRSLEEEMATCSSILAWEIPGTEEPGGLQSMRPQ